MKKCIQCEESVNNPNHDLCYDCWIEKEDNEKELTTEEHFKLSLLENKIYTVYIMFYGKTKQKIGYTNDLNSRIIEIRREYPDNKLVYFREFSKESEARRFEVWLKSLTDREITKFIAGFQDKINKVQKP